MRVVTKKFYTGIGSRKTPADVIDLMSRIASSLQSAGWILRSGGADGADTAFANGAGDQARIYRPLGDRKRPGIHEYDPTLWQQAQVIAQQHHPAWELCGEYARGMHTRNVFQVLGEQLTDPSKFVVCWTPDAAEHAHETSRETGGTGTAIRIADTFQVTVFNLARPQSRARIEAWLAD